MSMMFKTKRQLQKELDESNSDRLFYKNKLSMIESKLREQKETNKNTYTTLREINNIMYYMEKR